jgi:hypothetical protein
MFSQNSPVYWAFRIYAVCALASVVLRVTAWLLKDPVLRGVANDVLLAGLAIGSLPLVSALAHSAYLKLRRR